MFDTKNVILSEAKQHTLQHSECCVSVGDMR